MQPCLIRNTVASRHRTWLLYTAQIRHNSIAASTSKPPEPPKPPRADLQSIPQAIREILPRRPERKVDPNAKPKKKRSPLFYLALISTFIIWTQVEKHMDPKPLMEKKRNRLLRERLHALQSTSATAPVIEDQTALINYLRLLLTTMLPDDVLRNLYAENVLSLLAQDFPADAERVMRDICRDLHKLLLSVEWADEDAQSVTAQKIQDLAEQLLRKAYLVVYPRLFVPTNNDHTPS
ncbi:hypothetical protein C8J57DRAFT_1706633 [Mycena rebaudengoi]|nr:hypothetical protein C8J57DRAFT_1706633 [Mycena rebaudengoi]